MLDEPDLMETLDEMLGAVLTRPEVFIATDAFEKLGVATLGIYLPAIDRSFQTLLAGEEQTAYAAAARALLLVATRVLHLLRDGIRGVHSLIIVCDCMSAIQLLRDGAGSRLRLAAEARQVIDELTRLVKVDFVWVPSHGKISKDFLGHPGASEAQLRAWNAAADRSAREAWERLAFVFKGKVGGWCHRGIVQDLEVLR